MKKLFIFAMALFYVGVASAKINTVVVRTSGDVRLRQGDKFYCAGGAHSVVDSVLYLTGSGDYDVTIEELNYLSILSSGDVITDNTFNGKDLSITFTSSGDSKLDLNYDHVYVSMTGSGDLELRGRCNDLDVEQLGSGDLDTKRLEIGNKCVAMDGPQASPDMRRLSDLLAELGTNLEMLADSVDWEQFEYDMERWGESMEEWGRHMEEWGDQMERRMEGRDKPRGHHGDWDKPHHGPKPQPQPQPEPEKRSLLFDGHWKGIDAGLNMLLGPGSDASFEGQYAFLEQRPLKSWVFNFNLADVGIAFSRNHIAGLYTGIGLGWNNYSLDNPVRLIKGQNGIEGEWIDESVEGRVKKSKLGVLYVQAPLMLEFRPTRGFFIAAGVTGGLRIDTWTKVKFVDKFKEKHHGDYYVNPLKLDATLRAGGNDMGFFASFNLLPLFEETCGPTSHTFNVGFSLLF